MGLVLFELSVAESSLRGIESDGDVVGLLHLEGVEQHHRKTVHRVGQLSLGGGEGIDRQGEKGAIGQRVSVDKHQLLGH